MKTFLFCAIICLMSVAMHAQSNSGAVQTTNLQLAKTIEISVTQMNNHFGNDNGNGSGRPNVQQIQQTMQVRSNCTFDVLVGAKPLNQHSEGSENTTYPTTTTSPKPLLKLKVVSNATGGKTNAGYGSFRPITTSGATLINNVQPGADNTFSIQYMALPGYGDGDAGYDLHIVYTATQS